jgi:hypothetical protein
VAFLAGAAALASIAALVWAAAAADAGLRPVHYDEDALDADLRSAAKSTFGRRLLLIDARPALLSARPASSGRLLETGRSGGWQVFEGLPPGADSLRPAVERLEADVAAAYDRGGGFDAQLRERLVAFGVSEVAVHLHGAPATRVAIAAGSVQTGDTIDVRLHSADVHSFPVPGAEPVFAQPTGGLGPGGVVPALAPAPHLDYADGLWGGQMTVEVAAPGEFLFPWPAEGALVTVDGVPTDGRALDPELPLLVVTLPAGAPRVAVSYASGGTRSFAAMIGAAGLVISVLALLIAFRAHPERVG